MSTNSSTTSAKARAWTLASQGLGWVQTDDLVTETRWPRFTVGARELGVGSVLSCELDSPEGRVGALNLYSRTPDVFTEAARETAFIYAAHAGVALAAQRLQDSLRAGMESRETIGIAMGVLMERHMVTRSGAFDMLAQVSQETNTKVRELAERVITTGEELNPKKTGYERPSFRSGGGAAAVRHHHPSPRAPSLTHELES